MLYGRRKGPRLRRSRARLLATRLPGLTVPITFDSSGRPGPLAPAALFSRPIADLWLEIGFGDGAHLVRQALNYPAIGMIGCEPYVNGVASLLSRLARTGADLIRIHPDDALTLLPALPPASVGRIFILFPDPWPKRRHHKRRLINRANLDALARVLRPGGELRMATDFAAYGSWILWQCVRHPAFRWAARRPADWRVRPIDWPETRYERKAIEAGRRCCYLTFRRVAVGS